MKYIEYIAFVAALVIPVFYYSCADDSGIAGNPSLAIEIFMYNGSSVFDSTRVRPLHAEMSYQGEGEWQQVSAEMLENTFKNAWNNDSLKYIGVILIQKPELYHYLRIPIGAMELWKDAVRGNVNIRDSLNYPFAFPALKSSTTITLVIDLNAAVSIVNMGRRSNPDYRFRDRTRLTGMMAGEIEGSVRNHENLAVAYCITEGDTITSGIAYDNSGKFRLRFLSKGTYKVSVTDSLGWNYTTSVPLAEGQKVDLGDITLR